MFIYQTNSMENLLKSSVAGIAATAMDGQTILGVNEKLKQADDSEWAGAANDVIDKMCSYINNGASDDCDGINTGYDKPPNHPNEMLKEEGTKLMKEFYESNMDSSTIMKLFLEYEKEEIETNLKKGGGLADLSKLAAGAGSSGLDPSKLAAGAGVSDFDPSKLATGPGSSELDPSKLAAGLGSSNLDPSKLAAGTGITSILPPKDGIKSTESDEIMKVWLTKVGKQISCSKYVHDRIHKVIKTIFSNTLKELNDDGIEMIKKIFDVPRKQICSKINKERILAKKSCANVLERFLELEDDKLREGSIKDYVTAVGDMYPYLLNEEKYENGENAVEIVKKDYIEKVKDKELLKKIITGLDIKKYADFINILDMEGTSKTSEGTSKKSGSGASVSGGDWGIISSILLTGGKKKGKRKFTKKQRKQRKNRTR